MNKSRKKNLMVWAVGCEVEEEGRENGVGRPQTANLSSSLAVEALIPRPWESTGIFEVVLLAASGRSGRRFVCTYWQER